MIRLLAAVLLFASFNVLAEVTLTELNNNTPADADDVMGNFNALKQGVDANATAIDALPTPPTNCSTDQIIKWDGSAWVCASKSIARNVGCSGVYFAECIANCPAGTTVVSGGCKVEGSESAISRYHAEPLPDLSGWLCEARIQNSQEVDVSAYAICQ